MVSLLELLLSTNEKDCSICGLFLSPITLDGKDLLHPRFLQIEEEIQEVKFHIQLPKWGGNLGVDYGHIAVGALKLLKGVNAGNTPRAETQELDAIMNATRSLSLTEQEDRRVDYSQIWHWLHDCRRNRGELCNSPVASSRYAGEIRINLIC